jgi:secreted trypsin-like serine protease
MHEFPSMIALVAISINKVFCGGVIISDKYGLTGAHCFNEPEYANLTNVIAYVGEHDMRVQNETIYTEPHELETVIRHEKYKIEVYTQDYDIALIKTKIPIAFNLAVGPACLPFGYATK